MAHNPPAFDVLFETLKEEHKGKKFRVVVALSGLKDALQCMNIVHSQEPLASLYLTNAAHDKAMPVEILKKETEKAASNNLVKTQFQAFSSIQTAIQTAIADAKAAGDLVVVCGSIYMMPEARETLGVPQLRDPC